MALGQVGIYRNKVSFNLEKDQILLLGLDPLASS
jgi:hypothetical protein